MRNMWSGNHKNAAIQLELLTEPEDEQVGSKASNKAAEHQNTPNIVGPQEALY